MSTKQQNYWYLKHSSIKQIPNSQHLGFDSKSVCLATSYTWYYVTIIMSIGQDTSLIERL